MYSCIMHKILGMIGILCFLSQEDFLLLYRAVESLCSEGSVTSERDSGIGNCKEHYSATVPAVRHSILKTINKAVNRNSDMTL